MHDVIVRHNYVEGGTHVFDDVIVEWPPQGFGLSSNTFWREVMYLQAEERESHRILTQLELYYGGLSNPALHLYGIYMTAPFNMLGH